MNKKILIALVMILTVGRAYAQDFSSCRDKLVCDEAKILNDEQVRFMTQYHTVLLQRYDIDMRVVISANLGDLGPKTVEIFKLLSVGEKSQTRKGILLVIDPGQDKLRMEISAGLDAVYTDGFINYLEQRQMVPFFTASRVADGVVGTTEMIIDRAQRAEKKEEFINPDVLPKNLAIGAGAQGTASIGKGFQVISNSDETFATGMSPAEVVAAYHQTLVEGNAAPNLSIYTRATQQMRKSWVVTPAQLKNEYTKYQECPVEKVIITGSMAIVRYNVKQRLCSPYFLIKEDGEWRIDFGVMMQSIRFNFNNEWHFDMNKVSPSVLEALSDWQFDKHGFPY